MILPEVYMKNRSSEKKSVRKKRGEEKLSIAQIEKFEREHPTIHEFVEDEYVDGNGRAVINIRIPAGYELKNPFSFGIQATLSRELYDYIEEKAYPVPARYRLALRFFGVCDGQTRNFVKDTVTENYNLLLKDKKLDMKTNKIKSACLFIFGVIAMAASFGLAHFGIGELEYEILSIVASFSLWEAVDYFILERSRLRVEYIDAAQLATAEIEFAEDDPDGKQ